MNIFKHIKIELMIGMIGLMLIIFFAAAQQYYYIVRFDLASPAGVSFFEILIGQLYQWLIWAGFGLLLWKFMPTLLRFNSTRLERLWHYALTLMVLVFLNVVVISFFRVVINGQPLAISPIYDFFIFHIFQKSPIFFIAFSFLMVMYHFLLNQDKLAIKLAELVDLKESNLSLYNALRQQSYDDSTAMIEVKIGHRIKYVPMSSIKWVQADDYCVKIHDAADQVYTIRTSMKAMENELPKNQFFRIHRKSIVNTKHIVEFIANDQPSVVLDNGVNLSVATTRIKMLKMQLGNPTITTIQKG